MDPRKAIIIGAGPAGLTAAYELLTRTDIQPIVLEKSGYLGGLSRTVDHRGKRMDIGGHRFFSKSDRIMQWWLQHLPLQKLPAETNGHADGLTLTYHGHTRELASPQESFDPETCDQVMLVRKRKSRIYFMGKFFDYPVSISKETLVNLGALRTLRIMASYLRAVIFPPREINNLEQFFVSRFGRELYETFFKSYTEKVWGVPCSQISSAWGVQRIRGLSVSTAIGNYLKKALGAGGPETVAQKDTEISLIERFLYPKYGPGQMWQTVAAKVQAMGGEIHHHVDVDGVLCRGNRVVAVTATDQAGVKREFSGECFFSTMPIQELVRALDAAVPANVREVSEGLQYRDFITVGLLLKGFKAGKNGRRRNGHNGSHPQQMEDNWIYIQEHGVLCGRLQIFNNWSPYLVDDPQNIWVGLEYFCREGDALWRKDDEQIAQLAQEELHKIGLIERDAVLDSTVIRMPKSYPAYIGTYSRFQEIRSYLDGFANLFLIGRNGMHKYNNQDHSMLTAMQAVDNIIAGCTDKASIWDVNTDMEYHESR